MVPEEGLEPTIPEGNAILSRARIPVPPLRHEVYFTPIGDTEDK